MSDSPFRSAVEARSLELLSAALAPDVTFRSPAVHAPYEGRDLVLLILGAVLEVFEDFSYQAEIRDGENEMLRFRARVGDREVDGVDIVKYADGLVTELTVMIRPLSALNAVRDAMAAQLEAGR
jgi:hypothetical protein